MASESVENYLKTIYKLEGDSSQTREVWVTTSDIAERLSVSAPSVSRMMKRLSESDWVDHAPYRGVRLTARGRVHALRVIRNHRILETYLARVLGMSWDCVDEEVERLEHVVSDELVNRMEEALGFPRQDPHGSPIPDRAGRLPEPDGSLPLAELETGDRGLVTRIADATPEALSYLADHNIVPGVSLEVRGREPFGGPVELNVDGEKMFLGQELARRVQVRK